jgi:hypothetical protein
MPLNGMTSVIADRLANPSRLSAMISAAGTIGRELDLPERPGGR